MSIYGGSLIVNIGFNFMNRPKKSDNCYFASAYFPARLTLAKKNNKTSLHRLFIFYITTHKAFYKKPYQYLIAKNMKKFLPILATTFCLISSQSNATGVFIGADILHSQARNQVKSSSDTSGPKNGDVKTADKLNYGLNAGVRFDLLGFLASGEIFYDNLDISAKNFALNSGANGGGDNFSLQNRYGVKLNAGFAILPKVTPFLTYGFANVRYSSSAASSSVVKSEMAPLYGLGLLIDLPLNFSVKASYDYQLLNLRYANDSAKVRTVLGVARVGVVYKF